MGGVALITGGGTGVGSATAKLLAQRGWSVALNYSRSRESAEATAEACRAAGVEAVAIQANVASDEDCRRLVATTVERLGGLDLLVNSAAATQLTSFSDMEAQNSADLHRVFDVNVVGPYQMARAAREALSASGRGAIVNVSSIAGQTGSGSSIAYVVSKAALNTLTLTLARLLGPKVRVNAVLPGMIDTEWFTGNGVDAEAFAAMKQNFSENSALGQVSTAEDIAGAIIYVGVDAVRMTGQFLTIDAGFLLGKPPVPSL